MLGIQSFNSADIDRGTCCPSIRKTATSPEK